MLLQSSSQGSLSSLCAPRGFAKSPMALVIRLIKGSPFTLCVSVNPLNCRLPLLLNCLMESKRGVGRRLGCLQPGRRHGAPRLASRPCRVPTTARHVTSCASQNFRRGNCEGLTVTATKDECDKVQHCASVQRHSSLVLDGPSIFRRDEQRYRQEAKVPLTTANELDDTLALWLRADSSIEPLHARPARNPP